MLMLAVDWKIHRGVISIFLGRIIQNVTLELNLPMMIKLQREKGLQTRDII